MSFTDRQPFTRQRSPDDFSPLLRIPVTRLPSDLSRFNQLSLTATNASNRPIHAEMKLYHGTGKTESIDTPVSISGGRDILLPGIPTLLKFPEEAFGTYGNPTGWKSIECIEILFKPGKTDICPDEIVIEMSAIFGETRMIPAGSRLTPTGLSAVMKTDHNSLSLPSDPDAIGYGHGLDIPAPHPFPQESAEDMLQGIIMGIQLPRPIPWNHCPSGILEWSHFLHRHHFLRNVLLSLIQIGDNRFAVFLDETISDWIITHPVPIHSNGGAGPSWETLSAAWRLREWLRVKTFAWPHPTFRQEARELMLRSFWEHARHLMDHQGHPNNWIIVESAALTLAGICLPGFLDAQTWLFSGIRRLEQAMCHQFMDDGAHFEFSPLYQAICMEACLDIKKVAASNDIPLPDVFDEPLEKAVDYLAALHRPDFTWPALNDSGSANGDYTALMRLAGEIFHRKDWTWIGARGARGTPPTETIQTFPDAGIGIMRSGYDADAHYLAFRAGSAGMTHIHEDALSIDVAVYGTPCLVDPGITGYAPGSMTDAYRSAAAHNSLLIDGLGPLRSKMPVAERIRSARNDFSCFRTDNIVEMSGLCRDYRDASGNPFQITRTILFIDRSFWVIRDTVTGTGEHAITTCWQFYPGHVEMDHRSSIIRFVNSRGKGLVIVPCIAEHRPEIIASMGRSAPPCGWVSIAGKDVEAWNYRFTVRARLPITQMWMLHPVQDDRFRNRFERNYP